MNYLPISIISEIDGDKQVWTFNIKEEDLVAIMDKYGAYGVSVRGNTDDIASEISDIWK